MMATVSPIKVYYVLTILLCLGLTCLGDNEAENRSKYKYGYVINHKEGSTQAHLESRDGNLALGRYYVNLRDGSGQKVTYFANDEGFHSGVSYSSQNGKGSSKTQIAVGQNALAAFGKSESKNAPVTVRSSSILFGKKILQTAINTITPKPGSLPKLNYTPVPGGFYLTHESLETSNETTEPPNYNAGLTSQTFAPYKGKYSEEVELSKANTQTFYPSSENVKNDVKQLRIQSTTPSIKSYTSFPQQVSGIRDETVNSNVKVSTYATNFDDLSYLKQKSIEKTNFADIDAQIISEVQKHAEEIIMKDLQKDQNGKTDVRYFTGAYQPSTVTMQPIVVTNNGEFGLNNFISTTISPEYRKLSKTSQTGTINAVKIGEKNSDQTLEDSGYFRVSLSPSLVSSINVSQTPHQSINVESKDLNSVSNNSTLCEFNLCQKDSKEIFSVDLTQVKPVKEADSGSLASDVSPSLGTHKIIHTFYPENKLHDEKHFVTTIDVQKAISLDVNQNEAGAIQLVQNFPFNKIKSPQTNYNEQTTQQPFISNQISVTTAPVVSEPQVNIVNAHQNSYVLNTVTAAPGLFDATPNQNLAVLQGVNDITSNQYNVELENRIGNGNLGYENQLVVPPAPVSLTTDAANEYTQKQTDLTDVEKSIQELRQHIITQIDAQHEEEQRKQNLVDEERKQYFENLKKVEALKEQNSVSYNVDSRASVVQTNSAENNVELVPQNQYTSSVQTQYESAEYKPQFVSTQQTQFESAPQAQYQAQAQFVSQPQVQYQAQYVSKPQTQYVEPQSPPQPQYVPQPQPQYEPAAQPQYVPVPQPQYESVSQSFEAAPRAQYTVQPQSYQTEIKDFTHEVAVPQPSIQQTPNLNVYTKQVLPYNTQNIQTSNTALYDSRYLAAVDNNIQQSAPVYTTEKVQLSNYVPQVPTIAFQPRYSLEAKENIKNSQQLNAINRQVNTVPVTFTPEVPPQTKAPEPKPLFVNVPFDYTQLLQVKQPVSLLPTYPISLAPEPKIPELYHVPQQVALPIQITQSYKILPFTGLQDVSNKKYHATLTQKQTKPNKLKVQPLKPSPPREEGQREAIQNLLSQPQFHQTYIYPGLPINNRLQLRHIRKNQVSNGDQVPSQSVRRGKSLKNLRIEYGFKPPLRPSVEFSEEVKPSIYGSSVQPH